jgi:hypothetical protein
MFLLPGRTTAAESLLRSGGFAQKDRDDVEDAEAGDLKRAGQSYLALSEEMILQAIRVGELQEIEYGEPQAS